MKMANYKQIILEALTKVVSEHGYQGTVSNRDIHEQALAHRLAFHLENSGFFMGYHVDCEYNRHGNKSKTDNQGKIFRPDIIIHIRGNDDNNLIMIETKKFNDTENEIETTELNLKERSKEYKYQHAFLVIFPEAEITEDSIINIQPC
jgi:hypothetical protein